MIPTIGRTVIVLGLSSNGAEEHPAVITRSWGGTRGTESGPICVNLTVFPDCAAPLYFPSVMLFHTRDQALQHRGGNPHSICAFWPERA